MPNRCQMLKLTNGQIKEVEGAHKQMNVQTVSRGMAQQGLDPNANHATAVQIAAFCSEFGIVKPQNVELITQAHLRLGMTRPPDHSTVPLRRAGFGESEKVKAYLYGIEAKERRLILGPAKWD